MGVEPVQALHAAVVKPLATPDTPGAFYRRWRLMGFDGTVMDMPDSNANAGFGRSSGSRGEGAFPQVRKGGSRIFLLRGLENPAFAQEIADSHEEPSCPEIATGNVAYRSVTAAPRPP